MSHPPTVLVTGAAKRLGRAIALGLAQAGWRVAVHCHRSAQAAQQTADACHQLTPGAVALCADLADATSAGQLITQALTKLGHLDAVVNNASVFEHDDATSFSPSSLATHMQVNLTAPVMLAQALSQHLRSRGAAPASGVVVNLLDQKLWNPNPDFLSYTLSKAALQQATTLLAQALAPQTRVVGVAPGLTLNSHLLSQADFEALHTLSPLGKSSTVEDVVSAVVFACSNRSVTGATLLVDGGQHLMPFQRDFSMMGSPDA
ncbi:MAG: SDR family oxidoreductase [Betaproteobacteria bacterium]|nr:SDR family oxidoreductase [Betaproteobacteria bacterium]